jgi:hypothetical protein
VSCRWIAVAGLNHVAFALDGRTLATGEPTNGEMNPPPARIVTRSTRSGDWRARTRPIAGGRLAGYTRDGRFLLVVSGERRSMLLDARTLTRVKTFAVGGAVALSPAANDAAFGHPDGSVTLLDLDTGRKGGPVGAGEREHPGGELQPRLQDDCDRCR